jgi:hypothetical protein
MSNPWDRPSLPRILDADREKTYAGVGRVMSEWEGIEVTLSHLYCQFKGKPISAETMHEYGFGRNVNERIAILESAAHKFFCDQKKEAQFDRLLEEIKGYSFRRNDIAHGVVRPLNYLADSYTWWLLPAHYKPNKTRGAMSPEYAYTRPLMDDIADKMIGLNHRISALDRDLFPRQFVVSR